jgi:hypothetical protein
VKYGVSSVEEGSISAMCADAADVLVHEGSGMYGSPLTKRVPGGDESLGEPPVDVITWAD